MRYNRIVTIQDASCYGQCSLTVALPIISAFGIETSIVPTAVLSTHTSGFKEFTFRDLSGDLQGILDHWKKENLQFDAIYTGYLGNGKDVDFVTHLKEFLGDIPLIVDPAFGDNGKLYPGFPEGYVEDIKRLCFQADCLLPNLTEAYALLDEEYRSGADVIEAKRIGKALMDKGAKGVLLKGLSDELGQIGIMVMDRSGEQFYFHKRIPQSYHGTGDVFASSFVAGIGNGLSPFAAAKFAADFTLACIENTIDYPNHPYGVRFEPLLGQWSLKLNQYK